jgi:hypothetical protein
VNVVSLTVCISRETLNFIMCVILLPLALVRWGGLSRFKKTAARIEVGLKETSVGGSHIRHRQCHLQSCKKNKNE